MAALGPLLFLTHHTQPHREREPMSPTVPSFRHLRLCLSGTAVPAAFALAVILVAARRPGNGRHRRADATARSRNNERPPAPGGLVGKEQA